jgi:protein TonB
VPAEPAGGLVVYEQGKVVFRMAPSSKPSHPGSDSATVQKALTREGEAGTGADLGSSGPGSPESGSPERGSPDASSPSATNNYLLERFEPEYPEQAKERRIQGPVVLNALVGTDGAVRELKVISGDPMLVKAATDAVRRWRFQPHRLKARLVEFETRITVTFTLP